jgi:cytochrome c biogenesis protein
MTPSPLRALLRRFASLRVTLVGMILLALAAALSYDNPAGTPVWVLVVPLAFLAVNLLAAVVSNPRINRRGGLLIFHVGLLGIVVLAAVGRLTRMEAHVELAEGAVFAPSELIDVHRGPWHTGSLDQVFFAQGAYTVDYAPGMVRGATRNQVLVPDGRGGLASRLIGDDTPLLMAGYRIYTTFNKGFAPVLTWMPDSGEVVTGTVHMPSYPLFDFRQANRWTPPGGGEVRFWLQLDTGLDENIAWTLDSRRSTGVLVVKDGERRVELRQGQAVRLDGGALRYERLSSWMGYKLFYDPTLYWLFFTAIMAVIGLGAHLWRRFGTLETHGAGEAAAPCSAVLPGTGGELP